MQEITAGSVLTCHIEGGIEIARDCQREFGYEKSVVFQPFQSNFGTLLVRARKSHPQPNRGHLIIKKAFGHIAENQHVSVTTMDLDLRDPMEINSLPDLKNKDYEDVPNVQEKNVINVKEYSPRDEDDIVFVPA